MHFFRQPFSKHLYIYTVHVVHVNSCSLSNDSPAICLFQLFTDEDDMNPFSVGGYPSRWGHDDELSTLPSPSSSVVDLDSNAGTVETEVLLSSYKGIHQSSSGAVPLWKLNFYWN